MNNLFNLLGKLRLGYVRRFEDSSTGGFQEVEDSSSFNEVNVVTSRRIDGDDWLGWDDPLHAIVLDLDVPAYLIPSSTPGHSHLYIDVGIEKKRYFGLLDSLAEVGVLESGYVSASKQRGFTCLRLPWIKKDRKKAA